MNVREETTVAYGGEEIWRETLSYYCERGCFVELGWQQNIFKETLKQINQTVFEGSFKAEQHLRTCIQENIN